MAADTFIVFAASYDTLGAAEADCHAVRELYEASGLIDTYDAAVITRDDAGKVSIVAMHEQPTSRGAWRGLGIGLAGAGFGALAGHVTAGLRRADLKDLGEQLDDGHSGLVVVPSPAQRQDDSYRQAVAQAEAAVAEAESAAAAAEREAQRYSAFRSPPDSGAGGFTG